MTDLHVIPDDCTTWRVYDDADAHAPLTEHTNATDAERVADKLSHRHGGARVIVHDRYHRTHPPTPGLTTRAPAQTAHPDRQRHPPGQPEPAGG